MGLIVPEGAELGFTCPREECGHLMKFVPSEWEEDERTRRVMCEECGKPLHLMRDAKTFAPMMFTQWLGVGLLLATLGPPILIDMFTHPYVAAISPWLQEHLNISKWWLAFGMIVAGTITTGFDPQFPVLYAVLWAWCWWSNLTWLCRKGVHNSEDPGEVLNLEDQGQSASAHLQRVLLTFFMQVWVVLLVPMALWAGKPGVLIDSWIVGLFLAWIGFHWVNADYVPPWKRRIIDFVRGPAYATQWL